MLFILETGTVGGLSCSIWENSSGQFVAVITEPNCRWQSQPVATLAEAERVAREAVMHELTSITATIAQMATEVLSA
ncbi:MAG TPA: hypothetical protein V6D07_13130 [Trichocoleus sp.]